MSVGSEIINLTCDILKYYHLRDIARRKRKNELKKRPYRKKVWTREWICAEKCMVLHHIYFEN